MRVSGAGAFALTHAHVQVSSSVLMTTCRCKVYPDKGKSHGAITLQAVLHFAQVWFMCTMWQVSKPSILPPIKGSMHMLALMVRPPLTHGSLSNSMSRQPPTHISSNTWNPTRPHSLVIVACIWRCTRQQRPPQHGHIPFEHGLTHEGCHADATHTEAAGRQAGRHGKLTSTKGAMNSGVHARAAGMLDGHPWSADSAKGPDSKGGSYPIIYPIVPSLNLGPQHPLPCPTSQVDAFQSMPLSSHLPPYASSRLMASSWDCLTASSMAVPPKLSFMSGLAPASSSRRITS